MSFPNILKNYNINILLPVLLALVLAGVATWFGYSWYTERYEAAAQQDLVEGIEVYSKRLHQIDTTRTWEDLERTFEHAAKKHSKSKLYPFFLALQAEVLIQENKQNSAIEVLNQALEAMDKNNPIYYLYLSKLGLLKLDSQDAKTRKEGEELLKKLSQDNTPAQATSLYFLGLEAKNQSKMDEATSYFKKLVSLENQTGWSEMAQEKISQN